ncbi:MAG: helix-turn-helix transcriptional regulator [Oscillibacter sp.]|uniref:helix-turn-helix domain-containing protein n=1 Tax=Oscillibacter sp. TaxID=1945593 RepID=UPI00217460A9|nr:helix-turn-helix transcriptional regulator [Oscillibacter sp.]MCI8841035.1 helix-turn-helix transcriptional regulator [Oscillibacter sp.]MCI9113306.1 helix-turn-helix transcriptional regulator [Oscillibacter sp.]
MDTKATGALIAQRRKALALSQAELAERIHVTDKAVSRWETGRGMPGLDSLEPLSEALGLSVSELLSGKELTREELPKAAGGQIMESMKRENRWKWLAWAAMAAVTVLAIWGAGVSVQAQREAERAEQERAEHLAHYAGSVNPNSQEDLVEATTAYFEEQGMKTRFNPHSLKVRDWAAAGDYLAFLFSDREGVWCMSFWQRDEVYPERFRIAGGRSRIDPGAWGLLEWNFGTQEQPVLVASGVELPEEACFYEYGGDHYTLRSWVNTDLRTALGIFVAALPMNQEQPSAIPLPLYDVNGVYIPRDMK